MTKQEAYDKIVAYYSLPGTAFGWDSERGACVYLSAADRARCAVGVLIPEKEAFDEIAQISTGSVDDLRETVLYEMSDDNTNAPHLKRAARRLFDILGFGDPDMVGFLQACQRVHDAHAEVYANQWSSSRPYGDYSKEPIEVTDDLMTAKRAMLAELKLAAEDYGVSV